MTDITLADGTVIHTGKPLYGPARDAEQAACPHTATDGRTYRGGTTWCLACGSYVPVTQAHKEAHP